MLFCRALDVRTASFECLFVSSHGDHEPQFYRLKRLAFASTTSHLLHAPSASGSSSVRARLGKIAGCKAPILGRFRLRSQSAWPSRITASGSPDQLHFQFNFSFVLASPRLASLCRAHPLTRAHADPTRHCICAGYPSHRASPFVGRPYVRKFLSIGATSSHELPEANLRRSPRLHFARQKAASDRSSVWVSAPNGTCFRMPSGLFSR
ncbi:unnamed protein product [Protopolystoma xenopodis]|uniref:Uncharacterized protein n=1 Tax=Protopolystoma xenopodis TaxID=117903 RepID=A0A448WET4_9PLAT|nr:unnamed protein product [Protopolystoma xenopodis]